VKRLVLVRHAKAAKDDPRLRDFDRPLAPRGEEDAAALGRRLARRGVAPDELLASPARRTLETARLIARELDFPWDAIRLERGIYGAEPGDLLEVVRRTADRVERLLLVGHNPGISELARDLVREFREEMPTAAVVAIELPVDTWHDVRPGRGALLFYDFPKRHA
jgi:phosphohistidine phosphatase